MTTSAPLSMDDIRALAREAGFKVRRDGEINAADCPNGLPVPHAGCATRSLERFTRLLEARLPAGVTPNASHPD